MPAKFRIDESARALIPRFPRARAPAFWDVPNFAGIGAICGFVSAAAMFSWRAVPVPPSSSGEILTALLLSTLVWMIGGVAIATLHNLYMRKRRHAPRTPEK